MEIERYFKYSDEYFEQSKKNEKIFKLLELRHQAKLIEDWKLADTIRDIIETMWNYKVIDGKNYNYTVVENGYKLILSYRGH